MNELKLIALIALTYCLPEHLLFAKNLFITVRRSLRLMKPTKTEKSETQQPNVFWTVLFRIIIQNSE